MIADTHIARILALCILLPY